MERLYLRLDGARGMGLWVNGLGMGFKGLKVGIG